MVEPLQKWPHPADFHLELQIFISDEDGIEPAGLIDKRFSANTDNEAREEALATIKRNRDNNPGVPFKFQGRLTRAEDEQEIWVLDELTGS